MAAFKWRRVSVTCVWILLCSDVLGFTTKNVHSISRCERLQSVPVAEEIVAKPTETYRPLVSKDAPPTKESAFHSLATSALHCLLESDTKLDVGSKVGSSHHWIDDASALALQQVLNNLKLKLADERKGLDRDEASSWIKWMKSAPTPMIVDFTQELQNHANATQRATDELLMRLQCRLLLFPSGASLRQPLREPPSSIGYGKLLYGGVTRYRLLQTNSNGIPRRVGERTDVKPSSQDQVPAWMQYGGSERMYEAVDMGPAAILEIILRPRTLDNVVTDALGAPDTAANPSSGDMIIGHMQWTPEKMFDFITNDAVHSDKEYLYHETVNGNTPVSLSGKERNDAFRSDFQSSVGGLQSQIDAIVRRVLDGRVIRPAEEGSGFNTKDAITEELALAATDAEELALLGLSPVRGLLLYGPPGCGKTALARVIARALRARTPKIVSAPELLDRWVGGSEKLVRALFVDAEAELAACNGDATKSALHVIVIDEIDAVFRKRTAAEDSGEATRSSVVNQILAKLDGVNSIPNVLFIGMTNRRELLDDALLRPGRLEVQIEIPLPDKQGRREILQIHFGALRRRGRLSNPLCCAIDGVATYDNDPASGRLDGQDSKDANSNRASESGFSRRGQKRRAVQRAISRAVHAAMAAAGSPTTYDLAADYATGGFSGADIAGLVRCAGSLALARARIDGSGVDGLLITLDDVKQAMAELKQQ